MTLRQQGDSERFVVLDVREEYAWKGPELHPDYIAEKRTFGVWDRVKASWAMLPNAVLLWCLTADAALDGLNEMRGRYIADELRDPRD